MIKRESKLLERHQKMRSDRSREETTFQLIKDYVRPDTVDFSPRRSNQTAGDARRKMFDALRRGLCRSWRAGFTRI